jgi:hypothetical protein
MSYKNNSNYYRNITNVIVRRELTFAKWTVGNIIQKYRLVGGGDMWGGGGRIRSMIGEDIAQESRRVAAVRREEDKWKVFGRYGAVRSSRFKMSPQTALAGNRVYHGVDNRQRD